MKLVCIKTNEEFTVKNTRKPKMTSGYFGRTWDILLCIKINGEEVKVFVDTTWGRNCYFQFNNKWYSIPVWEIGAPDASGTYILRRGSAK